MELALLSETHSIQAISGTSYWLSLSYLCSQSVLHLHLLATILLSRILYDHLYIISILGGSCTVLWLPQCLVQNLSILQVFTQVLILNTLCSNKHSTDKQDLLTAMHPARLPM